MYNPRCDSDIPTSVSNAGHMQCTRRGVPQHVLIANRYMLFQNTENLSFWRPIHNFTQVSYTTPLPLTTAHSLLQETLKKLAHSKLLSVGVLNVPQWLYMNVTFAETDLRAIPLAHWHPRPWFNHIPSTPRTQDTIYGQEMIWNTAECWVKAKHLNCQSFKLQPT